MPRCGCSLDRRSRTYESRLIKYAKRGFAIGLPPSLYDPRRVAAHLFDAQTLLASSGLPKDGLAVRALSVLLHIRCFGCAAHPPVRSCCASLSRPAAAVPKRARSEAVLRDAARSRRQRLLVTERLEARRKAVHDELPLEHALSSKTISPGPPIPLLDAHARGWLGDSSASRNVPLSPERSWGRGSMRMTGNEMYSIHEVRVPHI
jgi:hypothetical protein